MAEIEFQKFGSKISNAVKKNPLLIGAGIVAAGAGIYFLSRGGSDVSYQAGYTDPIYDSSGGGGSDVILTDELANLLENILAGQKAEAENFADLLSAIQTAAGQYAGSYQTPVGYPYYQETLPETPSSLELAASLILGTQSIIFPEGAQYSTEQIYSMASWAAEENAAILSGAMGTSKVTSDTTMLQVFNPDGTVSFVHKSSKSSSYKSSISKSSSSSTSFAAAVKASEKAANKAVSSVTGKSVSIESQLSGMSQAQKTAALKSAGLI
jgi:hypothetical protein